MFLVDFYGSSGRVQYDQGVGTSLKFKGDRVYAAGNAFFVWNVPAQAASLDKIGTFDQSTFQIDSGKQQQWPGGIGDAYKPDDRPTCTTADFDQGILPIVPVEGHPNKTVAGCSATGTYEYQMTFKSACVTGAYTADRPCCKAGSVKVPNSQSPCSFTASSVAVIAIAALGAAISFGGFVFVLVYSQTKTMRFAQYRFLLLFSVGCTLASLHPIFFLSVPSVMSCTLRVWWFNISAVLVFAPLFVKLYRICTLVFNKKMKKMRLTTEVMFSYYFLIILGDVVLLLVWTMMPSFANLPKLTAVTTKGFNFQYYELTCGSQDGSFSLLAGAYVAVLLMVTTYYAISAWNIESKYSEARELAIAGLVLNGVGGLACFLVFGLGRTLGANNSLLIQSLATTFVTITVTFMVYVPKCKCWRKLTRACQMIVK